MNIIDVTNLEKTSEMIDEKMYWNLIEKSLQNTNDLETQEKYLINELSKLTPKEMIGFRLRTDKFLHDSYNGDLWCAAYIVNGGCSDDGFEYFRNWLISRGKEVFYSVMNNPDNLNKAIQDSDEDFEFEDFWHVACEAFTIRTTRDLYDYIDYDKFMTREGHYPEIKFNWEEEKPDTMKKICPKLFERYWE